MRNSWTSTQPTLVNQKRTSLTYNELKALMQAQELIKPQTNKETKMKMREFCELVEDANGPRLQYTYPFRATIYESHYAYGGPEEGGWWYDALGDVVESHFVTCEAELDAVRARREALEEELNKRLTWEAEDRIGEALENFKYPRYE